MKHAHKRLPKHTMQREVSEMIRGILLALAVSLDTLFAAMGCTASGITIPKRCAIVVSAVGTLMLAASLVCAGWLASICPVEMLRIGGGLLLCGLGLMQTGKGLLHTWIRRNRPHIHRHAWGLVIDICFDETAADADGNKILGWSETAAFAAALSVDSLVSGLGAGIENSAVPLCLGMTALLGLCFTILGGILGERLRRRPQCGWLGGIVLIVLAILRLCA